MREGIMRRQFGYCLFIGLLLLLFNACDKGTDPENEDRTVTLDGSGGGVIAYCYQPLGGGDIHQIYAINADGSGDTKLIESDIGLNHHSWSPDGNQLAAVGYIDGGFQTWSIFKFNFDGTDLTRLTHIANVNDSEPIWSPDGSQIAFTRILPNQNDRMELWIMNAYGANAQYIGVEGFSATWSPDGSQFVYTSDKQDNHEIYMCNIDGTGEQRLTETAIDEQYATWSPDGTQIAYCASTGEWNTPGNTPTYEIYIMNSDGSNVQQLTENTSADIYRWSPDGSMLAFVSDRHSAGNWEVYIMNVDGTNVRRVTHSPTGVTAINPAWRPE